MLPLHTVLRSPAANGVWTLSPHLKECNILHSKWVYKTKTDTNGHISRLKARLVACGNEQVIGVDYLLTFAAVMEMSTVKVILALVIGVDYLMTFAAVMEMSTVKVVLALVVTWGVPAKHDDTLNAYVKANKEAHLDIFLSVPVGMEGDW